MWLSDKVSAQRVSVTGFSRELEANELNKANFKKISDNAELLSIADITDLAKGFKDNQISKLTESAKSLLDSDRGKDTTKKNIIWLILIVLGTLLGVEWWLRKRWHLL